MTTITTDLTGLFKNTYPDNVIIKLIPDVAKLTKLIPFTQKDASLIGNEFHQMVILKEEQGFTYAAQNAGDFDLNSAISMTSGDAIVVGSQLMLRSSMSYEVAARAASGGPAAFANATELQVKNMLESTTKRIEIGLLHGGKGIGDAASSVNIGATSTTVQLSTASFAAGIWAGAENAEVNFYNTSDVLVSSGADAVFVVTSVDIANRKLVITGTATGITALDSAITSYPGSSIYYRGAHGAEPAGLRRIITNTGSLFNIDASVHSLWKGNAVTVTGALTMKKLTDAIAVAVARGLDEDVHVFVNPITWSNLNNDLAALRGFDSSYSSSKGENGVEEIVYHGQNGLIKVVSHNCVKEGEAFVVPLKKCRRIGASQVSFKSPGTDKDMFLHIPNKAAYEYRMYTNQSLFVESPARCVYISGIVNS